MARDRVSRKHKCHVFRCDTPARQIANTLRDICKKIMLERSLRDGVQVRKLVLQQFLFESTKIGQLSTIHVQKNLTFMKLSVLSYLLAAFIGNLFKNLLTSMSFHQPGIWICS